MPKFASSQEWLEQSSLLLKAYPTTTKISTKYNIPNPKKIAKSTRKPKTEGTTVAATTTTTSQAPTATLEVRTYNPEAGVILKYQTNKGWEVGRLMASLGRLGRHMAALPEQVEDVVMADVKDDAAAASGTQTPVLEAKASPTPAATSQQQQQGGGGGGGGKKKKKGRR